MAHRSTFFAVSFFICVLFDFASSAKSTCPLGLLFPMTKGLGPERAAAALLALRDLNEPSTVMNAPSVALPPNRTIPFFLNDTAFSPAQGLLGALYQIAQASVCGIIGEESTIVTETVAHAASMLGMPQIGYAATAAHLSNKVEFPSFLRTVPSITGQADALAAICVRFAWREVVLLGSAEGYGLALADAFAAMASSSGVSIAQQLFYLDSDPLSLTTALKALGQLDASIVIVVSNQDPSLLFSAAKSLQVTRVWLLSDSMATDAAFAANSGLMGGCIGVRATYREDTVLYTAFLERWRALSSNSFPLLSTANWPAGTFTNAPNFFTPYVYDSVFAFASALTYVYGTGRDPAQNKTLLLEALRRVRFAGVTGYVAFDNNGDRLSPYSIVNLRPGTQKGIIIGWRDSYTRSLQLTANATFASNTTVFPPTQDRRSCAAGSGLVRDSNGFHSCVECAPGSYNRNGDGICRQCAVGLTCLGGTYLAGVVLDAHWRSDTVALSYAVSVLGAWTCISLVEQALVSRLSRQLLLFWVWLSSASVVFGACAIWAMHMIGMGAVEIEGTKIYYDGVELAISLLVAVVFSQICFSVEGWNSSIMMKQFQASKNWRSVISRHTLTEVLTALRMPRLYISAIFLALSILVMHYLGMHSMRMSATVDFNVGIIAASVIICYVSALVALLIVFHLGHSVIRNVTPFIAGVMVNATHYCGMYAATFRSVNVEVEQSSNLDINSFSLPIVLGAAMCCFLVAGLNFVAIKIARDKLHKLAQDALKDVNCLQTDMSVLRDELTRSRETNQLMSVLFPFSKEALEFHSFKNQFAHSMLAARSHLAPLRIDQVLDHPFACTLFKDYLLTERNAESLLFYLDILEFRSQSKADLQRSAKYLCERYVDENGEQQVNLSSQDVHFIRSKMSKPTSDMFDNTARSLVSMLDADPFRRFQQSEQYSVCQTVLEADSEWKGSSSKLTSSGSVDRSWTSRMSLLRSNKVDPLLVDGSA